MKNIAYFLLGAIASLIPASSAIAQSHPGDIPFNGRDYLQQRYDNLHKGAAVDQEGCVNHLVGVSASTRPLVKTLWATFDGSVNNRNQWIEHGCTKSWTANSIASLNPDPALGTPGGYYEGHYFAYSTYVNTAAPGSSPSLQWRYYEGRVGASSGVPSGNFRYKIERDNSQPSRWCGYVNNANNYCITLSGIGVGAINNYLPYNQARYVTVGIESGNINQSFTNNTTSTNVWFKNISDVWARVPSMVDADNVGGTARPTWNSTYTPQSGSTPDRITYTR